MPKKRREKLRAAPVSIGVASAQPGDRSIAAVDQWGKERGYHRRDYQYCRRGARLYGLCAIWPDLRKAVKHTKRPPVFPEKGEQKVFLSDHIIIAVLRGLLIQEILQGDAT